jgi:Fe-S-cluster-containing hydrogenase component 2
MNTPIPWSTVFCRACQQNVRVQYISLPTHEAHANRPEREELVCLDANDSGCEGVCPMTGLPHAEMDLRLSESGM